MIFFRIFSKSTLFPSSYSVWFHLPQNCNDSNNCIAILLLKKLIKLNQTVVATHALVFGAAYSRVIYLKIIVESETMHVISRFLFTPLAPFMGEENN